MCAAKHAPRGPFNLLDRRHGLAVIVEQRSTKIRSEWVKALSKSI